MSNVPELRFGEFSGEWEEKKLGDLGKFQGGGTPDTTNEQYWDGTIPWISSSDLIDNDIKNIKINRFINEISIKESATKLISKDSILFVSRVGVGKLAIANRDLCTSQDFTNLTLKKDISKYIGYYFLANKTLLVRYSQGTSIKGFTTNDIKTLKLHLPSKPEQEKIASFLSSVDSKIEQLSKKRTLLEQYKKGVMQKIFSQTLRFKDDDGSEFPEWVEKKLGEIFEYKNGGSFENDVVEHGQYNLITLNSIDIKGNLKKEHKKINVNNNSLDKHDLIMVLSDVAHGNFLGLTAIIPEDNMYILNQRMGALKIQTDDNIIFLRIFINYNQKYFKLHGQGSSQQNLSKGDILKFKINLPSLKEQTKIANFLSSLDKKIELTNKELDAIKEFKKALLQKMFV